MRSASTTWAALWAAPHKLQWRFNINGVSYTEEHIQNTPLINRPLMEEPCVGRCCTGDLTLTIRKQFNGNTPIEIPKAAKVVAQCRVSNITGTSLSEWKDQGTYWISKRSGTDLLHLTCRDAMIFAGRTYLDKTRFTEWPVSMKNVVTEIASIMGVVIDSRTVIKEDSFFHVSYPNEDTLMSEVLAYIAAAHGGHFIITSENKLHLQCFPNTDTSNLPASLVLGSEYSNCALYSTGEQTVSRVTLTDDADNQFTISDAQDAGIELTGACFYATQSMVNQFIESPIGHKFTPHAVKGARISPLMEVGDTFQITYKGKTLRLIASTILLKCNAFSTADVSNYMEEDDEEEVPYTSLAELKASRYMTTSKSYFGNRINRTEGFVSEYMVNDTPAARLIANSERLAMQRINPADGKWEDVLYFDPVKRQYKFVGEVDIQVQSSGVNTYHQNSPPTDNLRDGDIWIDSSDGNSMWRYDADTEKWIPVRDVGFITYGRNYVLDSSDVLEIVDGVRTETKRSNYYSLDPDLFIDSERGKHMRISFDIKRTNIQTRGSDSSSSIYAGFFINYNGESGRGYRLRSTDSNFISTDDDWTRLNFGPMDISGFNPVSFTSAYFELNNPYTGKVEIRNFQIEVTDEFTDWKPASRDISHLSERVSYTELKVTDSAIINSVRSNAKYYYDINYGRNYLINSDKLCKFVNAVLDKDSINSYPFSDSFYHDSNAGEQIRISFDIKRTGCVGDSNGRYGGIWVYLTTSEENVSSTPFGWYMTTDQKWYSATDTDFVRIEFVYASLKPKNPVSFQRLFVSAYGRGTLEIKNVKVEVTADRYTPWCFALEDSGSAFVTLEERVRSAELKITDSAIVAAVTSSTQYQTDLSGKANSDELSALAQRVSSAELKITDSSIISTVTSSTQYQTDLSGKASASSVNGKADSATIISTINQSAEQVLISASKIKIGAFTFGQADVGGGLPDSLYCGGQLNSGSKTCTGIGASNSAWAFWAGDGVFRVQQNGAMFAYNAAITGTLTAGNWTFNSSGSTYSADGQSAIFQLSGGKALYTTSGIPAEYGCDYNKECKVKGRRVKLETKSGSSVVVEHLNGADDPSLFCDGAGGSWSTAVGNIGGTSHRWDVGYIRSFNQSSSKFVKHDIVDMFDVGDIIDSLRPVTFVYNGDKNEETQYGLVFEETLDVFPHICLDPEPGNVEGRGIDYTKLIPLLLRECKSLRERVKVLEQAS